MNLGMGKIVEIVLAPLFREEDVALAPEDNGLRLMLPQERLPLGIKLNVGPVVVEEIKLDALGVWTFHKVPQADIGLAACGCQKHATSRPCKRRHNVAWQCQGR